MRKQLLTFVFLILAITLISANFVVAQISDLHVYVRSKDISTQTIAVERGETIPIRVEFTALENETKVKVKAWIEGYRDDIEDETGFFDIFEGRSYTKYLSLEVPEDVDALDDYTLHVRVTSKQDMSGNEVEADLTIQKESYLLEILSVETASKVKSGKTLSMDIVVKNRGNHKLDDVYVRASIPELGVEKTEYMGDLYTSEQEDDDDKEDSKEVRINLAVPSKSAGEYTLEITVWNDDAEVTAKKKFIVEGVVVEAAQVFVQPLSADVAKGETTNYAVTIVNMGKEAVTYSISVEGTEAFATTQVMPSTITIGKDRSEVVNVALTPYTTAIAGSRVFTLTVKADGQVIKQVSLGADISEEAVSNALIISVVVLAIILIVLIIALIAKARAPSGEEEAAYY